MLYNYGLSSTSEWWGSTAGSFLDLPLGTFLLGPSFPWPFGGAAWLFAADFYRNAVALIRDGTATISCSPNWHRWHRCIAAARLGPLRFLSNLLWTWLSLPALDFPITPHLFRTWMCSILQGASLHDFELPGISKAAVHGGGGGMQGMWKELCLEDLQPRNSFNQVDWLMDEDGFKMDRKLALLLIYYILLILLLIYIYIYIHKNIHLMKGDLKACASDKHR